MINIITDSTRIGQFDFIFDNEGTLGGILHKGEFLSEKVISELLDKIDTEDLKNVINGIETNEEYELIYENWINTLEDYYLDFRDAFRTKRI